MKQTDQNYRPWYRQPRRLVRRAALLGLLLAPAGCAAFGAAAYVAHGPADIPAEYVPPATDPMLVLVESYEQADAAEVYASRISTDLCDDLKANKVAPLVDSSPLATLREGDREKYSHQSIDALGRQLDARQVLYVNLLRCEIESPTGSGAVRGHISATVRIVDSDTGNNRWPTSARNGQPINIDTAWIAPKTADRSDIKDEMASEIADKIGKLFHAYQPKFENNDQQ